ncbi:DUF1569 domain-containing protein [Mucilaginibacter gotjawali]|uniref:Uncharacterized protein n=2 Tax=Mucilaginibacter gotjawali TaxID=1550579 RepID=A0A120MYL1_9SPHI|nr:DUF1569 domain-containing protein [Mucilaginibacter gotjawali]MBB3055542.1 hypothetical protein [Mucilaginibacter gotjawali]BAU53178.1 hypothetical protein MgSA37_01345 [Mucilaginibacter gotjawali]
MKSIFNLNDNKEFIARINKLTPSTTALWGKMNVSQMLAHSQTTLMLALGEMKMKRAFIGLIFGKLALKKILNDNELDKHLPTFKEAKITDQRNFEEEKAKLIGLLKRFRKAGPDGLAKDPHPFFGALTPDEYDRMNAKHLDHHLRQFGV